MIYQPSQSESDEDELWNVVMLLLQTRRGKSLVEAKSASDGYHEVVTWKLMEAVLRDTMNDKIVCILIKDHSQMESFAPSGSAF